MAYFLRYCLIGFFLVPALSIAGIRHIVVEPGQLQKTFSPGQGSHAFWDSRNWNEIVSTQSGSRVNVPVTSTRKFTWPTWRGALSGALKVNPARVLGSAAVAGAVASVGWFIEDNTLNKNECQVNGMPSDTCEVPQGNLYQHGICHFPASETMGGSKVAYYGSTLYAHTVVLRESFPSMESQGWQLTNNCTDSNLGYFSTDAGFPVSMRKPILTTDLQYVRVPVPPGEIDGMVGSYPWSPADGSDAAPHVEEANPGAWNTPDEYEFTGPSSISGPAETSTTSSPDGTTVTESVTNYNFEYNTNPLSITTTTTTTNTTYNNGTQVSTQTTTDAGTVVDSPVTADLEIPTDCEFMPTVCEWLDWTKQELDEPDPDFSGLLNDEDFDRDFSISLNATCPAPYPINTQLFGTVYFQWDPLCLFAEYIRYLVLSGAILFAMYISLGIQRKG